MSINEQVIKAYGERRKARITDFLTNNISKNTELISSIERNGAYTGHSIQLPNIVITANNKINEINHIFQKSDTSIYYDKIEGQDTVDSNIVGDALLNDIISYIKKGIDLLEEHRIKVTEIIINKSRKLAEIEEYGPLKKLAFGIRSMFNPKLIDELSKFSEDESNQTMPSLYEYKEIDEDLFQYDIEENVVQSLVNYITEIHFDRTEYARKDAIRVLSKLGLEHLIPEFEKALDEALEKEPKEDKKSWSLTNEQLAKVNSAKTEKFPKSENHIDHEERLL